MQQTLLKNSRLIALDMKVFRKVFNNYNLSFQIRFKVFFFKTFEPQSVT